MSSQGRAGGSSLRRIGALGSPAVSHFVKELLMSETSPDSPGAVHRDLLFGVLALNAGIIDRTRFADACSAWVSEKETSLADWLMQRGWITAEDKLHIEYLLERAVGKCSGSPEAALATVADEPARESLSRLADPAVRQIITTLPEPAGHILL